MQGLLVLALLAACACSQRTVTPIHRKFEHPGIIWTRSQLELLRDKPWKDWYNWRAGSKWYNMRGPFETVCRNPDSRRNEFVKDMNNVGSLAFVWFVEQDYNAAGTTKKAIDILSRWATVQTGWCGAENPFLGADSLDGIIGADILFGTYPNYTAQRHKLIRGYFDNMWGRLTSVGFAPLCWGHRTGAGSHLWGGNQGVLQLQVAIATAVFTDNHLLFDETVSAIVTDPFGGLMNTLPSGQVGDTGRDTGHAANQFGYMVWCAEVAWIQGIDLFSALNNRLLAESEYSAQRQLHGFNVSGVPEVPYTLFGPGYNLFGGLPGFDNVIRATDYMYTAYSVYKSRGLAMPMTQMYLNWTKYAPLRTIDVSAPVVPPKDPYVEPNAFPAPLESNLTFLAMGTLWKTGKGKFLGDGKWLIDAGGVDGGDEACKGLAWAYKKFDGDATFIARIAEGGGEVRLIDRLEATPNARQVRVLVSNNFWNSFWRGACCSYAVSRRKYAIAGLGWAKIVRRGNFVTSYTSPDGKSWAPHSNLVLDNLNAEVFIGISVYAGSGTFADISYGSAPLSRPDAPATLRALPPASASGAASVALEWDTDDRAVYYYVWRADNSTAPYAVVANYLADHKYVDMQVVAGRTYWYKVQAAGYSGDSLFTSPAVNATASGSAVPETSASSARTVTPINRKFEHPGIIWTRSQLELLRDKPWKDWYNWRAGSKWYNMRGPFETVCRNPDSRRNEFVKDMNNVGSLAFVWFVEQDYNAAGTTKKAIDILSRWATVHKGWCGAENPFLGADSLDGIIGADILFGTYPNYTAQRHKLIRGYFDNMWGRLTSVGFAPLCWGHRTGAGSHLWGGNQGVLQLQVAIATAVFTDNHLLFDETVSAIVTDPFGGLMNTLPSGQVGDTGRDTGHAANQFGYMVWCAEVAWIQGIDLFSALNNRLLAESEYSAQRQLHGFGVDGVPEVPYTLFGPGYNLFGGLPGFDRVVRATDYMYTAYSVYKSRGLAMPMTQMYLNWTKYAPLRTIDVSAPVVPPKDPYVEPKAFPAPLESNLTFRAMGTLWRSGKGTFLGDGKWKLEANGDGGYETCKGLAWAYKKFDGDATFIARIAEGGGEVRLIDRLEATPNARQVRVLVSNNFWNNFWRGACCSYAVSRRGYNIAGLGWAKIVRRGNFVTSYTSPDGKSWAPHSNLVLDNLNAEVFIGISVYAGSGTFADISYGSAPLSRPDAPATLRALPTASASGAASVALEWDTDDRAVYYYVWRADNSTAPYEVVANYLADHKYVDRQVVAGRTYWYKVQAAGYSGDSLFTSPAFNFTAAAGRTVTPIHRKFEHPGIIWTRSQLELLRDKVKAGEQATDGARVLQPWTDWYNLKARSKWYNMRGPFEIVCRNPDSHRNEFVKDMNNVGSLAFVWFVEQDYNATGTHTLPLCGTGWCGAENPFLGADSLDGIIGADILFGTYPNYTAQRHKLIRGYFDNMWGRLTSVGFAPRCPGQRTGAGSHLWGGNQGVLQLQVSIATAVFTDNHLLFDETVSAIVTDPFGGLMNTLPSGQVGDTGRDTGHAANQFGYMVWCAEVAWIQGIDLFSALNNRLLAESEYAAQRQLHGFNVSGVPEVPYTLFGPGYNLFSGLPGFDNVIRATDYMYTAYSVYKSRGLAMPMTRKYLNWAKYAPLRTIDVSAPVVPPKDPYVEPKAFPAPLESNLTFLAMGTLSKTGKGKAWRGPPFLGADSLDGIIGVDILFRTYPNYTAKRHKLIRGYFDNMWGRLTSLQVAIATAVFTDNHLLFDETVSAIVTDPFGGLMNTLLSGQVGDTGRDNGHAANQFGYMVWCAEVAWIQGIDLFSALNNRLLAESEYSAQRQLHGFNVSGVPEVPYTLFGPGYNLFSGLPGFDNVIRATDYMYTAYSVYKSRGLAMPMTRKYLNWAKYAPLRTIDVSAPVVPPKDPYVEPKAFPAPLESNLTFLAMGTLSKTGKGKYLGKGRWQLEAGGDGGSETCKGLAWAYKKFDGDATFIARVVEGGGEVRLIDRLEATPNARQVRVLVSNGFWNSFWRGACCSYAVNRRNYDITGLGWAKIVRRGNFVTSYTSPDGKNWAPHGSLISDDLNAEVFIGISLFTGTGTFADISYGSAPLSRPDAPATFRALPPASARGSASVAIEWDTDDRAVFYIVWRADTSTAPYEVVANQLVDHKYVDRQVVAGRTYWYKVQAAGYGGMSLVMSPAFSFKAAAGVTPALSSAPGFPRDSAGPQENSEHFYHSEAQASTAGNASFPSGPSHQSERPASLAASLFVPSLAALLCNALLVN
eukprot:m51a1_g1785 putative exopolysaccharide inner membrane protein (2288) ;mRNA; r:356710-368346